MEVKGGGNSTLFSYMALYLSSFLLPASAGVPFLLEDKYLRGGFRILSTVAERDAIPTAARKVGMRVLVADAELIEYTLTGGTANTDWVQSTYVPTEHTHAIDSVTGLSAALSDKADVNHGHGIANVTGLQTELDSKAPLEHDHAISSVTGLVEALAAKAETSHTHAVSDVDGLASALDDKSALNHQHTVADVSDLQIALDGKADEAHNHAISEVTGLQDSLDSKISASQLSDALINKADVTHNHSIGDVSGLSDALSGKADTAHGHSISDVTGLQDALADKSTLDHTHTEATPASAGFMSAEDKIKLDSISGGANSYEHPTGDGYQHVPATGTTNNAKVLKAGATAGSAAWSNVSFSELTDVPTAFTPDAHTHNVAGVDGLQDALNAKLSKMGGTVDGNLTVTGDFVVQGGYTVLNTMELEVDDPVITVARGNSTGVVPYAGIKVERGASDAFLVFNEDTDRWTSYISSDDLATAGTLASFQADAFYGALVGNADSATVANKWAVARTISFTGDVAGSASVDGASDVSVNLTVSDDSHNHSISTVTGLQAALDSKAASVHTHTEATTSASGFMSAADKTKLNSVATNANNYAHPTGDGYQHVPATGTTSNNKVLKAGATAGSSAWGTVSYEELSNVPTSFTPTNHIHVIADVTGLQTELDGKSATAHTHSDATSSASGFMSASDKTKLNGVATNANNYVHPTSDGSLHVPATGTTNNGKVLKAGSTAGSASWGTVSYTELTNVPTSFTPAAHSHAIADVTGLQTALNGKLATTGKAADSDKLDGYDSASTATANTVVVRDSTGNVNVTDVTIVSDMNKKTLVSHISDEHALQTVLQWESILYTLNDDPTKRVMPGHSAQQVLSITPELVTVREDGSLGLSYALTSAYYAAALRAVMKRLDELAQR